MTHKQYHDLSDNEKTAIRNYTLWSKSDAPIKYKMVMLEQCYKVLMTMGIEEFVW